MPPRFRPPAVFRPRWRAELRAQGLQWAGVRAFHRSGYAWDVRRAGDSQVGVWRKKLQEPQAGATRARRCVLTPGFGDSPVSWIGVAWMLQHRLRRSGFTELVMVDLPGFGGRLARERCLLSIDDMFEATGDLYDWLEPELMIGHSLGGWLTSWYAADCGAGTRPRHRRKYGYEGPERVVLIAPAGAYESVEVRDRVTSLFADLAGSGGFAAIRPHLFAREPRWFGWLARDFERLGYDESIRQFLSTFKEGHLMEGRIGSIRARTGLLWGSADTLIPTAGSRRWLDELGGTDLTLLPGVGHSPHLEAPLKTARLISNWIRKTNPRLSRS